MDKHTLDNIKVNHPASNTPWPGSSILVDVIKAMEPGPNANQNPYLIKVADDIEAINSFLELIPQSRASVRRYRLEMQRFLMWMANITKLPLSGLNPTHIQDYITFSTFPPSSWCAPYSKAKQNDGSWRPFRLRDTPIKESTFNSQLNILASLFNYLVSTGYLQGNPVELVPRRRLREALLGDVPPDVGHKKIWTFHQYGYVLAALDKLPLKTCYQQASYERLRFWISCIYECALRIGDMSNGVHGQFRRDKNGKRGWNLLLRGKGDKSVSLPVSNKLLEALARYRTFHGLPPHPVESDRTPLLCSVKVGELRKISEQQARKSFKRLLQLAESLAKEANDPEADGIMNGCLHSIRHQRAQRALHQGKNLRDIQEFLRHKNISSTAIYTSPSAAQLRDLANSE